MVAQDPHNVNREEREPPAGSEKAANPPDYSHVLRAQRAKRDDDPPPPSWKTAVWLAIILLNVVLVIYVLPYDLLTSERVSLVLKVCVPIAAGGAFAAGVIWFQRLLVYLPTAKWFKVALVILFVILIPANAALRLPVVPLYPVLDAGTRLEVDGVAQSLNGGAVRVSLGPHKFRVAPPADGDGKPRDYSIGYGDALGAFFRSYTKRWSPLYAVDLKTSVPGVEVAITKTDEKFEPDFREYYEKTVRKKRFEPKSDVQNVFIWQGGDSPTGTKDIIYLPHGEYVFTAHKESCKGEPIKLELHGAKRGGHVIDFQSLCQ